jgi:predicted transposase YbfD/YdcC
VALAGGGSLHLARPPRLARPAQHVQVQAERHQGDQVSCANRYYITSLADDSKQVAHAVRAHWGIENQLHWVLDVTFREDDSRIRRNNAPANFNTLR